MVADHQGGGHQGGVTTDYSINPVPQIVLLSLPALRYPEGGVKKLTQLVTQRADGSLPVSLSLSSGYISSVRAAFGGKADNQTDFDVAA